MTDCFSCAALQLLRRMDHGEAVQIAGIPDAALRGQLDQLFQHLHLRKSLQVCVCCACCSAAYCRRTKAVLISH